MREMGEREYIEKTVTSSRDDNEGEMVVRGRLREKERKRDRRLIITNMPATLSSRSSIIPQPVHLL